MLKALALAASAAVLSLLTAARASAIDSGSTGGGQAHTNMQPTLGLNYFIRDSQSSGDKFAGDVALFAGGFTPAGWISAQGQTVNASEHPHLAAAIYGANAPASFTLPDLRGRIVMGDGSATVATSARALGETTGTASSVLTETQMPAHAHSVPVFGQTGNTGGGQSFSIMQPSVALNYYVRTTGVYPSSGAQSPFIGEVRLSVSSTVPASQYKADGQLLSIDENPNLHAVIGTAFGGNGVTMFRVPDLRGRVPIGVGQGIDPATGSPLTNRGRGELPGQETMTLNAANLPPHTHTATPVGPNTGSTGGGVAYGNMQPSLGMRFLIATQGIFPSTAGAEENFLGQISLFAGDFAPTGFAFCEGQLLPKNQNTALYAILGTTYGGDGINTFGLPDLRGRAAAQFFDGLLLGQMSGVEGVTLTEGQLPPHVHELPEPASLLGAAAAVALTLTRPRRPRHA